MWDDNYNFWFMVCGAKLVLRLHVPVLYQVPCYSKNQKHNKVNQNHCVT